MEDWKTFADKANNLLESKSLCEARQQIQEGLAKFPDQVNLLIIAADVYRASSEYQKSLEYSKLLIANCQDEWIGYGRAIEDLVSMNRLSEAEEIAMKALSRFPGEIRVTEIAIDLFRKTKNSVKLLESEEKMIDFYPEAKSRIELALETLSIGSLDSVVRHQLINSEAPIVPGRAGTFCRSLINCDSTVPKHRLWMRSFHLGDNNTHNHNNLSSFQPFQYWSQGEPPEDVKELTSMWNALFAELAIPPVRLFDRSEAFSFISEHAPELLHAFNSAFHYAIESDIFRIAFAFHNDCIYVDADCCPKSHTRKLICNFSSNKRTTLCFRWFAPWITNSFFMTPAQSPFFRRIIEATQGYSFTGKEKTRKEIFGSFGPARFNEILKTFMAPESCPKFSENYGHLTTSEEWELSFVNCHHAFSEGHFSLDYKKTNNNWWQQFTD